MNLGHERDIDLSRLAIPPPPLEQKIRQYLEMKGRGAQSEICLNTTITASEMSNWLAGRRPIPAPKLVEIADWLMQQDRIHVTISI